MRRFVVRRLSSTVTPERCVELDAGCLETHALDIGRAAHADQDLIDAQLGLPVALFERQHALLAFSVNADHFGAAVQLDAVALERPLDDLGGVAVLASQDLALLLEQRHP